MGREEEKEEAKVKPPNKLNLNKSLNQLHPNLVVLGDSVHLFPPPPLLVIIDVDDDLFVFLHRVFEILNLAVFLLQGLFHVEMPILGFGPSMRLAARTSRRSRILAETTLKTLLLYVRIWERSLLKIILP